MTAPDKLLPTREALLDAALLLFLERGFAATRVEDIAARAGISKGAVYLHFATKKELFEGVVQAGVLQRLEQAEQLAAGFEGSAMELLTTMLQNNLLEFWGSPSSGILKLVVAESQQFPELAVEYHETVTGRARELLAQIIRHGLERGEFSDLDPDYTARVILNALDHELVLNHTLRPGAHGRSEPRRYIEALLGLIRANVIAEGAS
ncbi:MAG: TetR/AcrR family transcriptional regulator [Gammaproteobacteria bacterium]|jgi:AcrR family transcriptional regulator